MSLLRATPLSIQDQTINNVDANLNAQAITQEQLSTGYKINQPSDSPGQISQVLSSNALVTRTGQYIDNINDGLNFLTEANSVCNEVAGLMDQAKGALASLAGATTQMGNPAPPDQIANELQGIYNDLMSLANSTYLGIPIFGGSTGSPTAFDANGNYLGSGSALTRTVAPGQSLQISVIGSSVFGDASTNPNSSVFGVLKQAISDIQLGNYASAEQADQSNLDAALTQVLDQGTQVGALSQAMQTALQTAKTTQNVLKTQIGNIDDVNIADATTQLQQQQVTYQSALWAAAQVNKYSLIQFIG